MSFEPGINCVIGPNGSGKSNIVDALTWVMGEQGAKNLRGSAMTDVIFAGTSKKPVLGRAEVTLTIDNTDGALPIEYTEVTISRRIFRAGGSEYAINGQPCRLLDIQDLLSDTGMGKQMHVIIGQGKLDDVLHASPEERRAFIEEAAGVLKHRKRKERAIKKLENIETDLTRVEDLAKELRRQLGPLARQAKAARQAHVLQAHVRDAQLRLLADDCAQEEARLHGALSAQKTAQENHDHADRLAKQLQREVEKIEARAREKDPYLHSLREKVHEFSTLTERYRALSELARERQRALSREPRYLFEGETPEHIRARAQRSAQEEEILATQKEEARRRLNEAIDKREKEESEEKSLMRALAEIQKADSQHRESTVRIQGEKEAAFSRIEALEAERARSEENEKQTRIRLATLKESVARMEEAMAEGSHEDSAAHELAQLLKNIDENEKDFSDIQASYQHQREEIAELGARERALRASLAPQEATAWALTQGKDSSSEGLEESFPEIVSIRDVLQADQEWARALETALGSLVAGVAVARDDDAYTLIEEVKKAQAGRIDILIAPHEQNKQNGQTDSSHEAGGVDPHQALKRGVSSTDYMYGPAAFHVEDAGQSGVAEALRMLLKGTYLAHRSDVARILLELGAQKVAVSDGSILTPVSASGGHVLPHRLLEIQNTISQLSKKRYECEANAQKLHEILSQKKEAIASLNRQREKVHNELSSQQAQRAAEEEKLRGARMQLEETARTWESLSARGKEIDKELSMWREKYEKIEENLRLLQRDPAFTYKEREEKEEALTRCRERLAHIRSEETAMRLEYARVRDRYTAISGKAESLMRQAEAVQARMDRENEAWKAKQRASQQAELVAHVAEKGYEASEKAYRRAQKLRDQAIAEREESNEELAQASSAYQSAREKYENAVATLHESEMALSKHTMLMDQLHAHAREDFALSVEELIEEYGPHRLVPMFEEGSAPSSEEKTSPYVRSEQEERLARSKKALERLGAINPLALEEHAALEERYRYVSEQLNDVKKTREDVLSLVKDLDAQLDMVLTSALDDVAASFQRVFPILFPGGQGQLVYTDRENPLATGVIIEARPAGKKVKRLSLLSGGERSLTALAYLVAIFMARPSPFYVLDEVEAALDDVNLQRLLEVFRTLRSSSQLLIITHQRRTMEIADALYGVSMREEGVTTVISQRLSELVERE